MIYFRLTPLWKIRETEQWLNDLAEKGQVLRAKFGSFYLCSQLKKGSRKNNSVGFGLVFYEKGVEDDAPWYLKFNGSAVPCHCSYYMVYQYRRSKTREQYLTQWYPYRDKVIIKPTLINHLLMATICLVVFPLICYLYGWKIRFCVAVVLPFLWALKNIYGLVVINRRLKHWGSHA